VKQMAASAALLSTWQRARQSVQARAQAQAANSPRSSSAVLAAAASLRPSSEARWQGAGVHLSSAAGHDASLEQHANGMWPSEGTTKLKPIQGVTFTTQQQQQGLSEQQQAAHAPVASHVSSHEHGSVSTETSSDFSSLLDLKRDQHHLHHSRQSFLHSRAAKSSEPATGQWRPTPAATTGEEETEQPGRSSSSAKAGPSPLQATLQEYWRLLAQSGAPHPAWVVASPLLQVLPSSAPPKLLPCKDAQKIRAWTE
jgi:hypothetical protein